MCNIMYFIFLGSNVCKFWRYIQLFALAQRFFPTFHQHNFKPHLCKAHGIICCFAPARFHSKPQRNSNLFNMVQQIFCCVRPANTIYLLFHIKYYFKLIIWYTPNFEKPKASCYAVLRSSAYMYVDRSALKLSLIYCIFRYYYYY